MPAEQVLPVHLPEPDQHGGVEHAEPAGRMAGEAQQRRRDEDDRDHDEAEIGLVRHQHIHRQRAEAEIDDADRDLQQRQRTARQRHASRARGRPTAAASRPRPHRPPAPRMIANAASAVEPGRQLIDRGGGFRMTGDAESEHRGVAEPEGQAGQEADLCDVDRVQPPGRIDPIAHRAAGEDAGADIVSDRIAGEGGERVDAIGNIGDGRSRAPRTGRRRSA